MLGHLVRMTFQRFVLPQLMYIWVGMNVWHRRNIPKKGPAIIVANHNSHFDVLAILALFPGHLRSLVRPVAAEDYFCDGGLKAWFSQKILGAIMIDRSGAKGSDPFAECYAALDRGEILVIFPEGTRGSPETPSEFKKGISYLARRYRTVPVIPIHLRGLGRVMGKGHKLPMPYFCDVVIGEPFVSPGSTAEYAPALREHIISLGKDIAR